MKRVYILTTAQSDAGSVGIFSRRTNQTQEAWVWCPSCLSCARGVRLATTACHACHACLPCRTPSGGGTRRAMIRLYCPLGP
eukprot:1195308-Prorocentrum_minimum.AAC.6